MNMVAARSFKGHVLSTPSLDPEINKKSHLDEHNRNVKYRMKQTVLCPDETSPKFNTFLSVEEKKDVGKEYELKDEHVKCLVEKILEPQSGKTDPQKSCEEDVKNGPLEKETNEFDIQRTKEELEEDKKGAKRMMFVDEGLEKGSCEISEKDSLKNGSKLSKFVPNELQHADLFVGKSLSKGDGTFQKEQECHEKQDVLSLATWYLVTKGAYPDDIEDDLIFGSSVPADSGEFTSLFLNYSDTAEDTDSLEDVVEKDEREPDKKVEDEKAEDKKAEDGKAKDDKAKEAKSKCGKPKAAKAKDAKAKDAKENSGQVKDKEAKYKKSERRNQAFSTGPQRCRSNSNESHFRLPENSWRHAQNWKENFHNHKFKDFSSQEMPWSFGSNHHSGSYENFGDNRNSGSRRKRGGSSHSGNESSGGIQPNDGNQGSNSGNQNNPPQDEVDGPGRSLLNGVRQTPFSPNSALMSSAKEVNNSHTGLTRAHIAALVGRLLKKHDEDVDDPGGGGDDANSDLTQLQPCIWNVVSGGSVKGCESCEFMKLFFLHVGRCNKYMSRCNQCKVTIHELFYTHVLSCVSQENHPTKLCIEACETIKGRLQPSNESVPDQLTDLFLEKGVLEKIKQDFQYNFSPGNSFDQPQAKEPKEDANPEASTSDSEEEDLMHLPSVIQEKRFVSPEAESPPQRTGFFTPIKTPSAIHKFARRLFPIARPIAQIPAAPARSEAVRYGEHRDIRNCCEQWYNDRLAANERSPGWEAARDNTDMAEVCRGIILNRSLSVHNGRYDIGRDIHVGSVIGRGMFGYVCMAQDRKSKLTFCVKKIALAKFSRSELSILTLLNHHSIVECYGALREGSTIYCLMEFIYGRTLAEEISPQRDVNIPMNSWLALYYIQQLLEVLVYLDDKHVIHEDIKSDNVMLRAGTYKLVLIDLGLARQVEAPDYTVPERTTPVGGQTQWSPEKATSEEYDARADVWAANCVFVHAVSGYPPWMKRFGQLTTIIYKIHLHSPPLEDVPDNLPPAMLDMVTRGFTVDWRQRPTARELLNHEAFRLLETHCITDAIFTRHIPSVEEDEEMVEEENVEYEEVEEMEDELDEEKDEEIGEEKDEEIKEEYQSEEETMEEGMIEGRPSATSLSGPIRTPMYETTPDEEKRLSPSLIPTVVTSFHSDDDDNDDDDDDVRAEIPCPDIPCLSIFQDSDPLRFSSEKEEEYSYVINSHNTTDGDEDDDDDEGSDYKFNIAGLNTRDVNSTNRSPASRSANRSPREPSSINQSGILLQSNATLPVPVVENNSRLSSPVTSEFSSLFSRLSLVNTDSNKLVYNKDGKLIQMQGPPSTTYTPPPPPVVTRPVIPSDPGELLKKLRASSTSRAPNPTSYSSIDRVDRLLDRINPMLHSLPYFNTEVQTPIRQPASLLPPQSDNGGLPDYPTMQRPPYTPRPLPATPPSTFATPPSTFATPPSTFATPPSTFATPTSNLATPFAPPSLNTTVPNPQPHFTLQTPPYYHQAQPKSYQGQPNSYQGQPKSYQAPPNSYQTQPNSYQAPPNSYQGQPKSYQAPPNSYQIPPNFSQVQPHSFQTQFRTTNSAIPAYPATPPTSFTTPSNLINNPTGLTTPPTSLTTPPGGLTTPVYIGPGRGSTLSVGSHPTTSALSSIPDPHLLSTSDEGSNNSTRGLHTETGRQHSAEEVLRHLSDERDNQQSDDYVHNPADSGPQSTLIEALNSPQTPEDLGYSTIVHFRHQATNQELTSVALSRSNYIWKEVVRLVSNTIQDSVPIFTVHCLEEGNSRPLSLNQSMGTPQDISLTVVPLSETSDYVWRVQNGNIEIN